MIGTWNFHYSSLIAIMMKINMNIMDIIMDINKYITNINMNLNIDKVIYLSHPL